MVPSKPLLSPPFALFLLLLFSNHGSAKNVLLEDGYTVTTVMDGHKFNINPHSLLPKFGSSDLIILDSSASVFYTLSLPKSHTQEIVVKKVAGAGDGSVGYSDGDSSSAQFNKPRSFAVDFKGNVYVADRGNNAIRKVSNSGVTTIAGGYSQKTGRQDGPAQNASFSDDFELVFLPQQCALLISDHGNQLVRQVNLKPEDCHEDSPSKLGAVSIWAVALVLSCVLGLVLGIILRPYVFPNEGSRPLLFFFSRTWRHCQTNLVKQVQIHCCGIRSAVVNSRVSTLLGKLILMSLSHLSLMFKFSAGKVNSQVSCEETISLLDSDYQSVNDVGISNYYFAELKDLISFRENPEPSDATDQVSRKRNGYQDMNSGISNSQSKIDNMIQANVMDFALARNESVLVESSSVGMSGLVKRR